MRESEIAEAEITADEWDACCRLERMLAECHAFVMKIGYGPGLGGRPVGAGYALEARRILESHGVTLKEGDS